MQKVHPLKYVKEINGKLHTDIPRSALFDYFDQSKIPVFYPNKIKPYNEIRRAVIDIETTGLDPKYHVIKYVGIYESDTGEYKYFYKTSSGMDEGDILNKFFNYLHSRYDSHYENCFIGFHHGFKFDLPFLIARAIACGLGWECPFYYQSKYIDGQVTKKIITFKTAQLFGKPVQYENIFYKGLDGGRRRNTVNLVDTYNHTLAYDFVARSLSSRSLKSVPYELGLITEPRTELTYKELLKAYEQENHELVLKYLHDDLEATMLLLDRFMPDIYYQLEYLTNWNLQTVATTGNATKWNAYLRHRYGYNQFSEIDIQSDDPIGFTGGHTFGVPGLYKNVFKIDVSSLYPSIMLAYGIYPFDKDKSLYMLSLLKYLKEARIKNKKAGKLGDLEAKQKAESQKVPINSAYGALGAAMTAFNDYRAASLVTAYGKTIVLYMVELVEKYGGIVVECDTDGLIVSAKEGYDPKEIHKAVQEALPEGIEIELEWIYPFAFIAPSKDDDAKNTKNYLILINENQIKRKGKFRKRDRCILEKDYYIDLLKRLCFKSRKEMEIYHQNMVDDIIHGRLDLDLVRITRKAKSNEKDVFERGLVYKPSSNDGDEDVYLCTFYVTEEIKIGKRGKPLKPKYVKTNSEPYSRKFYLDMVEKIYNDIVNNIKF